MSKLIVNPKTGLVPLKCLKDSAANGIRANEIRGFSPEIAENLVKRGLAEPVEVEAKKKAKAETTTAPAA